MTEPFVVGAYAALPDNQEEVEQFYATLAGQTWVNGLEIPFRSNIADDIHWFVSQLHAAFTTNVLTPIPGVMGKLAQDPHFGLASPDDGGRTAALDYLLNASWAIKELNDAVGRQVITHVALHSAPKALANQEAFAHSLAVASQWDWDGAHLVVEHQDAPRAGQEPEKGFLELADEIRVVTELANPDVKLAINWGRSAIEGHSAQTALEHIQTVADAGLLGGVIFSGAHSADNSYGPAWTDCHVPMIDDEPTSVLTASAIAEATAVARAGQVEFLGAKISIPASVTLTDRLEMIQRIASATE